MAAKFCFLVQLAVVQFLQVEPHTLYKWIVDSKTRFNYDPDIRNPLGVYNWRFTYPDSCSGMVQSPVDIQTDRVRYGRNLPCPRMLYTNSLLRGELKNNGHSATFEPENEMEFRLTDIPNRPGIYNLNDFHLHYGGISGRFFELQGQRFRGSGAMSAGSEHTIDGLRFEGEVHFVFYNSKYRDLEEADNKPDGVVVVVLLVQKLPSNMSDSGVTSKFSEFLETNIPRVATYNQNASLELDLSIFFARECKLFTYFGSTTTPTCHESVQWVIFREPIRVTERAWFQLTQLESRGDFNRQFGNYRNTQPLNDRVVEANFQREIGPVLPSPNSNVVRPMSERMEMTGGMRSPTRVMRPVEPPGMGRNMTDTPMIRGNMMDSQTMGMNMAENPMSRRNMVDPQRMGMNIVDTPIMRSNTIDTSMMDSQTMGMNMAEDPMPRRNMVDPQRIGMNIVDTPIMRSGTIDTPMMRGNPPGGIIMRNTNMGDIPIMMDNTADIPMQRGNMADVPKLPTNSPDISMARENMVSSSMVQGNMASNQLKSENIPVLPTPNNEISNMASTNMKDTMTLPMVNNQNLFQNMAMMNQVNMAEPNSATNTFSNRIQMRMINNENMKPVIIQQPAFPSLDMQIRRINEMTKLPQPYMPKQSIRFHHPAMSEQQMVSNAMLQSSRSGIPMDKPTIKVPMKIDEAITRSFINQLHPGELWNKFCAMWHIGI